MKFPKRWKLSLVGTALLAGLFFSVLLREDATLENSLVDLSIFPPVRRGAVLYPTGEILNGDLAPRTLDGGPYRLRGSVRVPPGTTVRVNPGTIVAAEESARLVVEGTLIADRATFLSNPLHPKRHFWHGITAASGGTLQLTTTTVADASAALTCAAGGSVDARDVRLVRTAAGLVTLPAHRACTVHGARITDTRVGLHFIGGTPTIEDVVFDHAFDAIRVFHEARPRLRALVIKHLQGAAVRYAATPALVVTDFALPAGSDRDVLIVDGADQATHPWNGQNEPTGRIVVR